MKGFLNLILIPLGVVLLLQGIVFGQQHNSPVTVNGSAATDTIPDYLVWLGRDAWGATPGHADSIFAAVRANGKRVALTDNLFRFGTDLSGFKAIFAVLGVYSFNHVIGRFDPEGAALEQYLNEGGRLYVEGGDCFYYDPIHGGYDMRSWFSLDTQQSAEVADMYHLAGQNFLQGLHLDYTGPSRFMDVLVPRNSAVLWTEEDQGVVSGVWNVNENGGLAIAVVPAFGGLNAAAEGQQQQYRDQAEQRRKPRRADLTERGEADPSAGVYRTSQVDSITSSVPKKELMGRYLQFFSSRPAFTSAAGINRSELAPQNDTLMVTAAVKNEAAEPITVQALISSVTDSMAYAVDLYDDGTHGDQTAADDTFSGSWISDGTEDNFSVTIATTTLSSGAVHTYRELPLFSTAQPLIYYGLTRLGSDTIPNPGDRFIFRLQLKNSSQSHTYRDVRAEVFSMDTSITGKAQTKTFGDIGPGEIKEKGLYSFTIASQGYFEDAVYLNINISADGFRSFKDSIRIDVVTGIKSDPGFLPQTTTLYQNYPNPFNPKTLITYRLAQSAPVDLSVFNALGQKVTTLVSGPQPAGLHRVQWTTDSSNLASGVYWIKLKTGQERFIRKALLLR